MKSSDTSAEAIAREAHAWVRRLTSGEATVADARELKLWCEASAEHAAAFAQAQQLWRNLGPAGKQLLDQRGQPRTASHRPRRMSRRAFLGAALTATAAAVVLTVNPPLGWWPAASDWSADYRTATGEQRQVRLSAHVTADLNTQTTLAERQTTNDAHVVELIHGEVAFQRESGAGRVFTAIAGDARAEVNDFAHFQLRYADNTVCVTCLAGEVSVEHGNYRRTLRKGEQALYGRNGQEQVTTVDPAEASAWREGVVIFRHTPLTEAVAEVNRYRPGRIILLDTALAKNEVSGRFRIHDMDQVITQIQQAFSASVTHLPGNIVLLG
jgi:transmembrane sensor